MPLATYTDTAGRVRYFTRATGPELAAPAPSDRDRLVPDFDAEALLEKLFALGEAE